MAWRSASRFSSSRRCSVPVSSPISRVEQRRAAFFFAQGCFRDQSTWRAMSRSSRFIESGPSARCLPPVTVTLWKHSPELRGRTHRDFPAPDRGRPWDRRRCSRCPAWAESLRATCQSRRARECSASAEPRIAAHRFAGHSFVRNERELRLRVFRMNEEGRASVDVAAQQLQAFSAASHDFTTT